MGDVLYIRSICWQVAGARYETIHCRFKDRAREGLIASAASKTRGEYLEALLSVAHRGYVSRVVCRAAEVISRAPAAARTNRRSVQ